MTSGHGEGSGDGPPAEDGVPADEDAPALILFTSGSSGMPKAVELSRRSVLSNQHNLLLRSRRLPSAIPDDSPQGVTLICTPLFHIGGISNLVTQLILGGKIVLNEGRFDPKCGGEPEHLGGALGDRAEPGVDDDLQPAALARGEYQRPGTQSMLHRSMLGSARRMRKWPKS